MKSYEEYAAEFETGKEYSREDIKALLANFKRYHDTIASFIGQFERVFLIAGEACGYAADDLCTKCGAKHG